MRGQILGCGRLGGGEPGPHVRIGLRGGQQRRRPVVALAMQLRRKHARPDALRHRRPDGVEAGIGQRQCVVFRAAGRRDARAVGHFQHHPQRHHGRPPAAIAHALQRRGQAAQCAGLRRRSGAPVIAFDDEHRLAQHRLAPARGERRGKRQQHARPHQQQHRESERQRRHRYPIRAATSATCGSTRSIFSRLRPSFHLSSRISEKAL